MGVKTPVYVAGFDRGVRPIGDWSISMTLSISFKTFDRFVRAGFIERAIEISRERLVENFIHQRGFAGTGNPGDDRHQSDRKRHIDILQIVFCRAANHDRLVIRLAPLCGTGISQRARKILSGEAVFVARHRLGSSRRHDVSAFSAGAGSEIDDVVGPPNRFFVVFDNDTVLPRSRSSSSVASRRALSL